MLKLKIDVEDESDIIINQVNSSMEKIEDENLVYMPPIIITNVRDVSRT